MKKTIYNRFPKELIASLPVVSFQGRIEVVLTESQAARAVDYLLTMPLLGVDTETRPSFRKGHMHKVSLLQVSAHDICFLFRLNRLGMSRSIKRLLEDRLVPKIGLSLHDDMNGLHKLGDFRPGCFIDLQDHMNEIGIEDLSLQKLFANLLGKKINKREQLSNWECDILSEKQMLYAATDAWACIILYEELLRLKQSRNYVIISTDDEATIS